MADFAYYKLQRNIKLKLKLNCISVKILKDFEAFSAYNDDFYSESTIDYCGSFVKTA